MRFFFLLFFLLISCLTFSQTQNQKIAEDYILLRTGNQNVKAFQTIDVAHDHIKCGFPVAAANKLNEQFTHPLLAKTNPEILQRPNLPLSLISPKGYFKIHYTTSGNNAVQYDINAFAIAADSAYDFEINFLGYPIPPDDNSVGGDNRIDIYILNIGAVYGFTEPEEEISPGSEKFTSHIQIHNSFAGFYTTGINAAMVTIAHELHHVIQIGAYGIKYSGFELLDQYFYEMHSTAMEEFVFDAVNDYYAYIKSYFNRMDKAFATNSGYDLAVWNLYLKEKFDFNILKRQWELKANYRAIQAIAISIDERASSFNKEFNEFGIWCYFTGSRAITGKYFHEGVNYPLVKPFSSVNFSSPGNSYMFGLYPTSNTYLRFINSESGRTDSLYFIITNGDIARGIDSVNSQKAVTVGLFNSAGVGLKKLTDDYYASITMAQPEFWFSSQLINNIVIPESGLIVNKNTFAYPSPFIYSRHLNSLMTITLESSKLVGDVEFSIYSSSMDLVCRKNISTVFSGNNFVKWNVKTDDGDKLPSGVYIYVISKGKDFELGKFVVIND